VPLPGIDQIGRAQEAADYLTANLRDHAVCVGPYYNPRRRARYGSACGAGGACAGGQSEVTYNSERPFPE
jgi:hypothetical protein